MTDDRIVSERVKAPSEEEASSQLGSEATGEGQEIGLREYFENVAAYQSRVFDASSAYNQVVVLAGYAGFFAIWSSLAPDTPRWILQLAGALMMVSLIVYVGWTVGQMVLMRGHTERMMTEIAKGRVDFHARIAAAEAKSIADRNSIMRWWKPVVWAAGGPALVAAALVGGTALLGVAQGPAASPALAPSSPAAPPAPRQSRPAAAEHPAARRAPTARNSAPVPQLPKQDPRVDDGEHASRAGR